MIRHTITTICFALLLMGPRQQSLADQGHPIAVSVSPAGIVVETMAGFQISIDTDNRSQIRIGELSDLSTTDFQPAHQIQFAPTKKNRWHVLRQPNSLKSKLISGPIDPSASSDGFEISQTKPAAGDNILTRITADGVTIVDLGKNSLRGDLIQGFGQVDVVVASKCVDVNNESLQSISNAVNPQIILIAAEIDLAEIELSDNDRGDNELSDNELGDDDDQNAPSIESADHNTVAVTWTKKRPATRWIKITQKPWSIQGTELGKLFALKELSSAASRSVFKNLSVEQMNFVPGDGSHTPRWNTEHMMGRELLFFSQIYHAVDPAIAVMNLNPKQMPADYVAAHPDWTGQQEALLTLQVESFSRRFAYLLLDLPLDKKTEGSKMWSPRSLLKQMQRHYTQHTDNVKKKMKLSNWPR